MGDKAVITLANAIGSNLEFLAIESCFLITTPSINVLADCCPNLQTLKIKSVNILNTGIENLANKCRKLVNLDISGCYDTKEETIKLFGKKIVLD